MRASENQDSPGSRKCLSGSNKVTVSLWSSRIVDQAEKSKRTELLLQNHFLLPSESFCSFWPELHIDLFTQSEAVVLKLDCA